MAVWMFFLVLMTYALLRDDTTIDLAESRDEASIEATAARFNAVAGRRRGPRAARRS